MNRLNKKGISPVIATVIIVSVAIAIAVAVAFWMTGITGLFTRYERVEITNCYADWNTTCNCWLIVIQLRNSGSDDATLDEIFINGRPHAAITNLTDTAIGCYNGKVSPHLSDGTYSDTAPTTTAPYVVNDTTNKKYVYVSGFSQFDFTDGVPLKAGEDMTIVIIMAGPGAKDNQVPFRHGASIEVKLHTAAGKEYPKTVVLP